MDTLNWIFKRRSIRKFTDQVPDDAQIEQLLAAAMAAPSAVNTQPWRFVVVRDAQLLKQIRGSLFFGKINAPCVISVCADTKHRVAERFWVQDCSAATENLLLAAANLGLGAVWCGVHPIRNYEEKISTVLALPEGILPLNIIFVGYPAEEKAERSQYDAGKVFREQYGQAWQAEDK